MSKEKGKEDLNKALCESIDDLSETTKKSTRKIFDALVEQGVQTISNVFDKYTHIAKQKVISDAEKEKDDRRTE